jgi:hypothetical protein
VPFRSIQAVPFLTVSDLRGQLMFTFLLLTTPFNLVLERGQVQVLHKIVAFILEQVEKGFGALLGSGRVGRVGYRLGCAWA